MFENNMQEFLKLENEKRIKSLLMQKTIKAKEKNTQHKAKARRALQQEKRQYWVKQQAIEHTYGSDEVEDDAYCRGR